MYLLHWKVLRREKEARSASHLLLSFLYAIALAMFLHRFNKMIRLANSFRSNSVWKNMESIFSALYLLAMVSETRSETAKDSLRNSALDKVFSWIHIDSDTVREGMDRSTGVMSSTIGVVEWNEIEPSEVKGEAGNEASPELGTRKRKRAVRKRVKWEPQHNNCDVLHFNLEEIWFTWREI